MQMIMDNLDAATDLFGVFLTLAVLIAGFFLGRRWMKQFLGYDTSMDAHFNRESDEMEAHDKAMAAWEKEQSK